MDEYDEADILFSKKEEFTTPPSVAPYENSMLIQQLRTSMMIINILGGITDIILVILLHTTRKSRSRTFLIHMCATEAVLLLGFNKLLEHILQPLPSLKCLIEHFIGIFLSVYLLMVCTAQIVTIMETRKVSTKFLLSVIYISAFLFALLRVLMCTHFPNLNKYMKAITALLVIAVLIIRVFKDISYCYKQNPPVDNDEIIRVNIIRIFVYIIIVTFVMGLAGYLIFGKDHLTTIIISLHVVLGVRPIIILTYVLFARKQMQMELPNLRFNNLKYDVESSDILNSNPAQ